MSIIAAQIDVVYAQNLVQLTMDHHHLLLLKHSSVNLPKFLEKFNTLNAIPGVTYIPNSIPKADKAPVLSLVQNYYNTITGLFVYPINKI